MKVVTIIGARPQFIKAAIVSKELRKRHDEVLVHTGQHYDYNMSEKFFEELDIPRPKYNLGISGGTHAEMTGKMLIEIEKVLNLEKPDWLLVYGDTNSTLAAALAAAKLKIKICHVEAGARTHCLTNPEEINRVCTDHLSSLLLASTMSGIDSMNEEGLGTRCVFVGDPMYDAFLKYSEVIKDNLSLPLIMGGYYEVPEQYYYLTCHREENTSDNALLEILAAMNSLTAPTIYPVHPRNRERAVRIVKKYKLTNIKLVEPVGYFESIFLVKNSNKIVTDSGGLQREAFFAKKQCITVLDFVCWPETMVQNRNVLARPERADILNKLQFEQTINNEWIPFGDGNSSIHIVEAMENYNN